MNDWWWSVVTDFFKRVAASRFHDASEPPPSEYAAAMLSLIDLLKEHPVLRGVRPGLYRRTLTLRPTSTTRKMFVRYLPPDLYEIEMEDGGILMDLPWDGRIVVPADTVVQALVNCKQHLEVAPN
jgi:hypothetical protein